MFTGYIGMYFFSVPFELFVPRYVLLYIACFGFHGCICWENVALLTQWHLKKISLHRCLSDVTNKLGMFYSAFFHFRADFKVMKYLAMRFESSDVDMELSFC
jgi:hypothetical protein